MPDSPWLAQIEHQGRDHEDVAQEAREDGGSDDGFELLQVEEVDDGRKGEGPRREADAAEQVKPDPEAPGELVAEVGDSTQSLGEAQDRDDQEGDDDESR